MKRHISNAAIGALALAASFTNNTAHATLDVGDRYGTSVASGDFNCDGFADVAVGIPGQTVNGMAWAGAVRIYYGAQSVGLQDATETSQNVHVFDQGTNQVAGTPAADDTFGWALAAGNFNGDSRVLSQCSGGTKAGAACNVAADCPGTGATCSATTKYALCDDLAVGSPGEDFGVQNANYGGVTVLYSAGASGLSGANSQEFGLHNIGSPRFPQAMGAYFGSALAAADLENGKRPPYVATDAAVRAELIVGAPYYTLYSSGPGAVPTGNFSGQTSTFPQAGIAAVIWSNPGSRLDPAYAPTGRAPRVIAAGCVAQQGSPTDPNIPGLGACAAPPSGSPPSGPSGNYERFGSALAAAGVGYATGTGIQDLVVGAPGRQYEKGSVFIVKYAAGLNSNTSSTERFRANSYNGANYGCALATGYIDGSGAADLAVGACNEIVDDSAWPNGVQAGAVYVYKNHSFAGTNNVYTDEIVLSQSVDQGDPEDPGSGDTFGTALAFGNFDGANYDDLCVGVPGETIYGSWSAGAINVFYGTGTGGLSVTPTVLHEGLTSIVGVESYYDYFGTSLAAGNFHFRSNTSPVISSVVVGVPGQGYENDYGKIQVIFGDGVAPAGLNMGKPDFLVMDWTPAP